MNPNPDAVLAVDPSIRSSGVAVFRFGRLAASTVIKLRATDDSVIVRCLDMADTIAGWSACVAERVLLVVEWPQWYRAAKSKGDPNDLAGLAGVSGALAGILAMRLGGLEAHGYTPAQWAGQLPKSKTVRGAKTSPRAVRILSRLSPDERACVDERSHDAIDAIGLGLYHLGRLEPRRVYPGAA
jgi:hypothetical protein